MDYYIFQIANYAESLLQLVWLPVILWTIISFGVWLILKVSSKIHPEYQHQTRLALIFALPAGLIFLVFLNQISSMLSASASETALKLIYVVSPVDFVVTPVEESAGIPFMSVAYASILLLFAAGMIYFLGRFVIQCVQLYTLKKSCELIPISKIEGLSPQNIGLAMGTRKPITLSFLETEIVPVTFGFRKPVILLPNSLRDNHNKMNLAVRHELTHIKQHDFFSHMIVVLTEALFWFHPLVHKLKTELVEYREMRCDHLVLSEKSVSKNEYASLLLELIPKPNINKELSVNMAQESSNLKKRITMITQQGTIKPISKRSSIALLGAIFLSTAIVMACTDMQTSTLYDDEELNLLTDIDRTGERGYHQILIFMGDEEQAERHESRLAQLRVLQPEHIKSIEIFKGDAAVEQFGERGEKGVIKITTNLSEESYNTALKALGLEPESISPVPAQMEGSDANDYFVVVEDMPELIGGLRELQRNIRYPEVARRAGIEGRVYVQFVINEQGDVENPQILRGIGGGADEEALRVVRMAKFTPGMQRGRPVRVQYSLPIFFRLAGSENTPEQTPIDNANSLSEVNVTGYSPSTNSSSPAIEGEVISRSMTINFNYDGSTITGTVVDGQTREPLAGANITLDGANRGTAANVNGEFSFSNLPSNLSHITFSYIGYRTQKIEL